MNIILVTVFSWLLFLGLFVYIVKLHKKNRQFEEHNKCLREDNKRLEEQAHHDPLTGLANRERIKHRHNVMLGMNNRSKNDSSNSIFKPITMAMIDIDYFKQVNDTCGHVVGDEVLCMVAECLKENKRPNDELARYGGEEFAMLLSRVNDIDTATHIMERIRIAVSERNFSDGNNNVCVTVSIGVHIDMRGSMPLETLYSMTDANLYVAKNGGRNCIVATSSE